MDVSAVRVTSFVGARVVCWHVWDLTCAVFHLLLAFSLQRGCLRSSLPEPLVQDMNYGDSLCF